MSTMTMNRQRTRRVGTGYNPRTTSRHRGPATRPSAMMRPAGRPVHPSHPLILNSHPIVVDSVDTAPDWHLTDRGLAVIMGLGAAVFAAAAVVIVLQFMALGAPIA